MRVMIVESTEHRAELMRAALSEQGYVVETCANAIRGCERAATGEADIIILAAMLDDDSAEDVCRQLREGEVLVPIIVAIEKSVPGEAGRFLDAGADVCLVAPWRDPEQLSAQIRSLLRHDRTTPGDVLRAADIELNLARRAVQRAGKGIDLTRKEFELLHVLMRNPDRVMSRTSIGVRVWGEYWDTDSNVVDVCVSNLRRKLDCGFDRSLIRTVRGSGYMLATEPDSGVRRSGHGGTAARDMSS